MKRYEPMIPKMARKFDGGKTSDVDFRRVFHHIALVYLKEQIPGAEEMVDALREEIESLDGYFTPRMVADKIMMAWAAGEKTIRETMDALHKEVERMKAEEVAKIFSE